MSSRPASPARLAFFTPIHHNPPLADRKASFLLTASGLISTILLLFSQSLGDLLMHHHMAIRIVVLALLLPLIGLLIFGAVTAWRGFVVATPPMPPSLANFPDIARQGLDDYIQRLTAMSQREVVRAILHYNYSLAGQSVRKFRLVNRAFACFRVALVLWMLLLVIISVAG